ncbi:Uncharacterized protein TCM_032358 [Theobroma cacao]|uniref:Uncharacterized protein n=1 Tax=Theobroma cacao TaxID=3641 RepID=A0A061FH02_THECC|nr:Uncharacterized protein TCM_032358 [Theobroma cacao]
MEETMAKFQNLGRFTTEVAPPQLISVAKPPLRKMLATIAEEEKEFRDDEVTGPAGRPTIRLSRKFERSILFLITKPI